MLWAMMPVMTSPLEDSFVEQLNAERQKVDVSVHNFSVRELVRMMAEDELNVAPAYQRKFRWDDAASSLFIESVFLGLPVPPIFVATNVGYQWEVVDGLQRLSSLTYFTAKDGDQSKRVGKDAPLILTGLEKLSQLNGVTHAGLSRNLQVYFGRQPLQVVSLTDKSDLEVRFDVFERLNRGGITLTAQEVRACVYRGDFNNFIEELSGNSNFLGLLKLQRKAQSDGTKVEEVLKFFAYKNFSDKFDGKVEKFLNRYMLEASKQFSYAIEREIFETTAQILYDMCGQSPLLRADSKVTPLVLFEACMVAIAELITAGEQIVIPPTGWQDDAELRQSTGAGSNTRAMLTRRMTRAKEIFRGDS
jgi:hypothetical protein